MAAAVSSDHRCGPPSPLLMAPVGAAWYRTASIPASQPVSPVPTSNAGVPGPANSTVRATGSPAGAIRAGGWMFRAARTPAASGPVPAWPGAVTSHTVGTRRFRSAVRRSWSGSRQARSCARSGSSGLARAGATASTRSSRRCPGRTVSTSRVAAS